MSYRFRLKMQPPTVTAQEHKIDTRGSRPRFYDPPELKETRSKLTAYLSDHAPAMMYHEPLVLYVKWLYQSDTHKHGEWRSSKPDTDNLQKLLKDCMTQARFWKDDALIVKEDVEKRWVNHHPGIYIEIMTVKEYEEMNKWIDE